MIDFSNPVWHKVRVWAEQEIAKARTKNDALGLTIEETSALRGEIRALKRLIGLPQQAAREVVGPPVD